MYDLLIRDALVVDGSGEQPFPSDVGVVGDRIAGLGRNLSRGAHRIIVADGRVVAPGFIDLHTHVEYNLERCPRAPSMVRQGVTTVVVGNCGFSPFPIVAERRQELIETSSFIPGAPSWNWTDAYSFLDHLDNLPLALNVATLVGHGALRIAAMGLEQRPPSDAELAQMKAMLGSSLSAGAFGLSTGLIYAPGNFSKPDELAELARSAADRGFYYASHVRGEGDGLLDSVAEAIDVGRRSGTSVQVSHVKATGRRNWGRLPRALELLRESRADGLDVLADQYPYTASRTAMTALLPPWTMDGGVPALLARLADTEQRRRIHHELSTQPQSLVRQGMRAFEPDTAFISGVGGGPAGRFEGRSVVEAAADVGADAAEFVLRILDMTRGKAGILLFSMSEDDVRAGLIDPFVAVASDGGTLSPEEGGKPHPRSYGTFARVLGHYVREEKVLSLETAIFKMTALPARRLRIRDRGRIRHGEVADLVVFDQESVLDTATYQDPHAFCDGVSHVLVGGQVVIDDGADTGVAAGKVLRRA